MSAITPSLLLLDTNVWLDNYLGYRPHTQVSRKLISESTLRGITLCYAATSANDLFYLVREELKKRTRQDTGHLTESQAITCNEAAWACVQDMTTIAVATTVAEPQVSLACNYRKLSRDFEDDLILAAMETSKADYLVTNDEGLCKKSPFPTLSSQDMLATLELCA